jgi:hypothetical protein
MSNEVKTEIKLAEIKSAIKARTSLELVRASGAKYCFASDRAMYLAYGYLRGIPYRVIEPTARSLFLCYGHYGYLVLETAAAIATHCGRATTKADLEAWMGVPETPDRKEKRVRAEGKAKARREARRDEYNKILAMKALSETPPENRMVS